jgi:hypothetical protein
MRVNKIIFLVDDDAAAPLEDPLAREEKGVYSAYPHQEVEIALQQYFLLSQCCQWTSNLHNDDICVGYKVL